MARHRRSLFRVTPKQGQCSRVADGLRAVVDRSDEKLELTIRDVRRKNGKEQVVDVTTSLFEILGTDELSADEIDKRLRSFIEPLLKSVQK